GEIADGLGQVGARPTAEGHHGVDPVTAGRLHRGLHRWRRHVRLHPRERRRQLTTQDFGEALTVGGCEPPFGRHEEDPSPTRVSHEPRHLVEGPRPEPDLLRVARVRPGLAHLIQLTLVSAWRPSSTTPSVTPSLSSTVHEPLSGRKLRTRSSPVAKPTVALMAM